MLFYTGITNRAPPGLISPMDRKNGDGSRGQGTFQDRCSFPTPAINLLSLTGTDAGPVIFTGNPVIPVLPFTGSHTLPEIIIR